MVSGWLLVRRVPPSGRAAGWMGREARKYSTHQAAKLRGIVAWGSTIAGGAALLFSVERWYKVCWEGNMVPGSGVKEHVSATGPPGNAHSSSVPAALQGYTGKVATYADLMVCSSEKGDVEYISNGGASWGGGEAIDIR